MNDGEPHVPSARWRKSSYSGQAGGDCVEVAEDMPGVVPVRDSKDPNGPALVFPAEAWADFLGAVKSDHFPV
jgi:uncharacterized protein DUF397